MRLYFLRHGQAGDKDTWPGDDFQRTLTAEGRAEMEAAAKGLRALGLAPSAVLSSPLVRARQTAEIAARALGMAVTEASSLAPGCDLDGLAEALRPYRSADEALVVGHEPDFSTLIGLLIAKHGAMAMIEMKKGACCRVDLSGKGDGANTLAGRGTLAWLLTAKQLGRIRAPAGPRAAEDA
jgi:phosphohistidine phosphatase